MFQVISNLKVSDGDLLMVHLEGGNVSSAYIESVRAKLFKWCQAKGLSNVEIMITGGDVRMSVVKVSVNDVFEDEVLKGDDNG